MAENSGEQPLLKKKKVCYKDCPGCKMEQHKEENRGIPFKSIFFISITMLCNSLPITNIFPYVYFMISDFHVTERKENIGFYAGLMGSSLMFARSTTSVFWGVIADRYGRKPVILIGTFSGVVFNILFGLSTNFWMALSIRILLGISNGLLGTIKAYASEASRPEHESLALSIVSVTWGLGLIVGPALGGFLAQPAQKFPNLFSEESLFGKFPYLLPGLCIAIFAAFATIACFWFPESIHKHHEKGIVDSSSDEALEAVLDVCEMKTNEETDVMQPKPESLLKNWPLMSSIIVFCLFSLYEMAYSEVFSLWAVNPRELGGLGYSSDKAGEVISISGIGILLCQVFLYPMIERMLGIMLVTRLAALLSIVVLSTYPLIAQLSGFSLFILLSCASTMRSALSVSAITGLNVIQNNVVHQSQRGAANGIAMTGMSFFNGLGPAIGGILFSWATQRQHASFLPGIQLVFVILNAIEALGLLLSFKPFLVLPHEWSKN